MFSFENMHTGVSLLRDVSWVSILLRLCLATLCGGIIGIERGRKGRTAGFRTHVLVCIGSALTVLTNQYMMQYFGNGDPARLGAQVINGIGFLGAGTIIVTGRHKVKGLTTAAGLWASACMGLAIGAGFYECVAMAFLMIFLSVHVLSPLELLIIENARNMNIYVEFRSLDNVGEIISRIKAQDAQIYEAEVDHGQESVSHHPNAIFALRMQHKGGHARLLASISEMEDVYVVHDI